VETRVDRPDPGLHFLPTTPFAHHFRHRHCLALVFSIHRLQRSVETHSNQLPTVHFLVAHSIDTLHGFIFYRREVPLSSLAPGVRLGSASRWLALGYCHLGGAASGVAFLPIIISFQVVWTSLEVTLVIQAKEETSCKMLAAVLLMDACLYVSFNNVLLFVDQFYLIYTIIINIGN